MRNLINLILVFSYFLIILPSSCHRPFDNDCDPDPSRLVERQPEFEDQIQVQNLPFASPKPALGVNYDFREERFGSLQKLTLHSFKWWPQDSPDQKKEVVQPEGIQVQRASCSNCSLEISTDSFPKIGYYKAELTAYHCIEDVTKLISQSFFVGPKFQWLPERKTPGETIKAGDKIDYKPKLRNDGIKPGTAIEIELRELPGDRALIDAISPSNFSVQQLEPGQEISLLDEGSLSIAFKPDIQGTQTTTVEVKYSFTDKEGTPFVLTDSLPFTVGEGVVLELETFTCVEVQESNLLCGDPRVIQVGESKELPVEIVNNGAVPAKQVKVVALGEGFDLVSSSEIGEINPNQSEILKLEVRIPADHPDGIVEVPLTLQIDGGRRFTKKLCLPIYQEANIEIQVDYLDGNPCITFPCALKISAAPVGVVNAGCGIRWYVDDTLISENLDFQYEVQETDSFRIRLETGDYTQADITVEDTIFVAPVTGKGVLQSGIGFYVLESGVNYQILVGGDQEEGQNNYKLIEVDNNFQSQEISVSEDRTLNEEEVINFVTDVSEEYLYASEAGPGKIKLFPKGTTNLEKVNGSIAGIHYLNYSDGLVLAVGDACLGVTDCESPYLKALDPNLNLLDTYHFSEVDDWDAVTKVYPNNLADHFVVTAWLKDTKTLQLYYLSWDGSELRLEGSQPSGINGQFDKFSAGLVTDRGNLIVAGSDISDPRQYKLMNIAASGIPVTSPPVVSSFTNSSLVTDSWKEPMLLIDLPDTDYFILCTSIEDANGLIQVYLAKFHKEDLTLEWERFHHVDPTQPFFCRPRAIRKVAGGAFVIVGVVEDLSGTNPERVLFIKTDSYGRVY